MSLAQSQKLRGPFRPTIEFVDRTGVGVLDRAMAILAAVQFEPHSLPELVESTGLSRATAHRLATALEAHGMLQRDAGRWRLGPKLHALATMAWREQELRAVARPALERLRDVTGESAQLFVRHGDERLCIESIESANELRTIVPVWALLPITAGSAGKVFMAHADEDDLGRLIRKVRPLTSRTVTDEDRILRQLHLARRRGWAESVEERQQGVASVSAPVFAPDGSLLAAASVSGPVQRTGRTPGRSYAEAVKTAAREITTAVSGRAPS